MGRIRSKIGHGLRAGGAFRSANGAFSKAQLDQLRAVVAEELQQRTSPRSAPQLSDGAILDTYAAAAPSAQLAVDVFKGEWSSRLPTELKVDSGSVDLFHDSRIQDAIDWLGQDLTGKRILELGPLEGGHTYMLDRAGARVHAIESNSRAFLKCLVTKELLGMKHARFSRGDFVAYLKESTETYDVVLASGVVYHMVDPFELLTLLASTADRLIIWTHYFDAEQIMKSPIARQFQRPAEPITVGDATYLLHPRDYLEALGWGGFCGGPATYARWMERDNMLDTLRSLGFNRLEVRLDQPTHPNGPSFLLLAERSR